MMHYSRKVWVLAALLLPSFPALAQVCSIGSDGAVTVATQDTRVNVYYAAPDPTISATTVNAGATQIPIDVGLGGQASQLASGLSTQIQTGDVLLVMQMMGADIDTSDNQQVTGNYGDGPGGLEQAGALTSNFNVGQYEFVLATGPIAAGSIPIQGEGAGNGLLNAYSNSNTITATSGFRRYQVVKVPQFTNLTISGEIVSDRWNGRWGGISALNVRNTLTLDGGSFNADGRGYRGGQFTPLRSDDPSGNFGFKGEGIAGIPQELFSAVFLEENPGSDGLESSIPGYPGLDTGGPSGAATRDTGLGAPGNAGSGGGGGEDAGGGGGANFGRGGSGGAGIGLAGGGIGDLTTPGIGGANYDLGTGQLIMGGGGGASNGDDLASLNLAISSGQAGGGIVFVRTPRIVATGGAFISANGQSGGSAISEGGGGGGAGGSVLIHTDGSTIDGLTISSIGGTGSTIETTNDGSGGGGGGGVVLLSDTSTGSAVVDTSGGSPGESASGLLGDAEFDGTAGGAGFSAGVSPIAEFDCDFVNVGLAKTVSNTQRVGTSGLVFDIQFTLTVENLSTTTAAPNIQIDDDLADAFPGVASIAIQGTPTLNGLSAAATAFNGDTQTDLLAGTDTLAPGQVVALTYTARIDFGTATGPFDTQASVTSAVVPGGFEQLLDLSNDGLDPDPDADGDALETTTTGGDSNENTATSVSIPETDITAATCVFSPNPAAQSATVTATCTGVETGGAVAIVGMTCGAEASNTVICTGLGGTVGDNPPITTTDLIGNSIPSTGVLDVLDDSDGDGLDDDEEILLGTDPDNPDTDGDGIEDGAEGGAGTDPVVADTDGDGIEDGQEVTLGTDPTDADTDDDGLEDGEETGANGIVDAGETNPLDADSDDDGLTDGDEQNGDGPLADFGSTNPLNADTDNDGIADGIEAGLSTSGVADGTSDGNATPFVGTASGFVGDADPNTRTNPTLLDSDGDGLNDGIEDANQDGATVNQIGATGTAGSGETDPSLADTDNDGLNDGDETNGSGALAGIGSTDPLDTDTDDGGTFDGTEVLADSTDPTSGSQGDDAAADADGDGLSNAQEAVLGTDPNDADTDDDGLNDGMEVGPDAVLGANDTDPLDADSDDDGLSDSEEVFGLDGQAASFDETNPLVADSDGDGILDGTEAGRTAPLAGGTNPSGIVFAGTDPAAGSFVADADPATTTDPANFDSDNDGLSDGEEDANADGATINTIGATNTAGSGETDPNNPDTDNDSLSDGDEVNGTGPLAGLGTTDPLDTDTDDGGTEDGTELLADSSNPVDTNGSDDAAADPDSDGLSNAQEAILGTDPNDADTDNDGIDDGSEVGNDAALDSSDTDPLDADTDDDGIPDGAELLGLDDLPGSGDETDPLRADSDADGIFDGTEIGTTVPVGAGTSDGDAISFAGTDPASDNFVPDADPSTTTDPTDADTDNDAINDGMEDVNGNGAVDASAPIGDSTTSSGPGDETDANNPDTDGDGLLDGNEISGTGPQTGLGTSDPRDTDTDNGGVNDGAEVAAGSSPGNTGDDIPSAPDQDGDGTPDDTDPEPANPCVPSDTVAACDTDGDGLTDGDEIADGSNPEVIDTDGDGIPDGSELGDTDNDGIPDNQEIDSDNDGIPDRVEVGDPTLPSDTDGDGIPDQLDLDSDNDGIPDATESLGSIALSGTDSDSDGIDDALDVDNTGGADLNGDGVDDSAITDTDGDNIPDFLDRDSDDDGIPDAVEGQFAGTLDTDSDGLLNHLDLDSDNDGIADSVEANVTGNDADNDEVDDLFDADFTGGFDNNNDSVDDALSVIDTDNDGAPDYLDLDSDNDTLTDVLEAPGTDVNGDGFEDTDLINQAPVDTDSDGTPDFRDLDSNNDGINDLPEENAVLDADGNGQVDDPTDTDGDGVNDLTDPLPTMFGTLQDADGDGIDNQVDLDADNDGIPNAVEAPGDDFTVDTDGDGVPDFIDLDSDNDGISDLIEADLGIADVDTDGRVDGFADEDNNGLHDPVAESFTPVDTDGDGVADFRSLDSDGDGLFDLIEVQLSTLDSNNDGVIDDSTDSDNDGLLDVADGLINDEVGTSGADIVDTDSDGAPNFRDIDSDADGLLDGEENIDANGDNILDFLQPQQVVIETATRGSGGALSPWEIAALALGGLLLSQLRRRRLRQLPLLVALIVAVPMGLNSQTAHADCASENQESCWYGLAGAGFSRVDPENNPLGFGTDDDSDFAWKVGLGYQFTPRWFAEVTYADLGEAGIGNPDPALDALVDGAEIDYRIPALFVGGYLYNEPTLFNPFAKIGIGFIQNDSNNDIIDFEQQTDAQFALGVGVQVQSPNRPWFLRLEFDSYDRDAWQAGVSIGRVFNINRSR